MTEPSAIERAREIAAQLIEVDSDNPLRVAEANRVLAGDRDDHLHVNAALAALQADARSERDMALEEAARVADRVSRECKRDAIVADATSDADLAAGGSIEASRIAKAIRALKGTDHDH